MKKIVVFLFMSFVIVNTNAQDSRKNAGQMDGPKVKELRELKPPEIAEGRNDINSFTDKFINAPGVDLGCPVGFAFSLDAFSRMRKDLGIERSFNGFGVCYSVSMYPALNNNTLYLVFKGEEYSEATFDHPATMNNKSYFILKANNTADLEEVSPTSIFRKQTEVDIAEYQKKYGNTKSINLKSLRIHMFKYDEMVSKLKNIRVIVPATDTFYFFRLRLAFNEFSDQDNKLYCLVNAEEATITAAGVIRRKVIDDEIKFPNSWYNHMDPCPNKCPTESKAAVAILRKNKNVKKKRS